MIPDVFKALGAGLKDAGVGLVTNFPGSGSHHLLDAIEAGPQVTSINERTAFAVAWGAAAAGMRAAVALKNVGLNDTADLFLNAMTLKTGAGLVMVLVDDIDVEGSQLRQDSRHYFSFHGGLWLEPTTLQQAYQFAADGPGYSETLGCPVVIRLTNLGLALQGTFQRGPQKGSSIPSRHFDRRHDNLVAHPTTWKARRTQLNHRRKVIEQFVEGLYPSPEPAPPHLVIGMGVQPRHLPKPDLTLFSLPLPHQCLKAFLSQAESIEVREHGDAVVAQAIKAQCHQGPHIQSVPVRHEGANTAYISIDHIPALSAAMRQFDNRIVCGDIGSVTMDPFHTVDLCLSLGASVGIGIGAALARTQDVVFVLTGDAAFFHSGQLALPEARTRRCRLVVILIDNGGSQSTGGQQTPGTLETLPDFVVTRAMNSTATQAQFHNTLLELLDNAMISMLHITTP